MAISCGRHTPALIAKIKSQSCSVSATQSATYIFEGALIIDGHYFTDHIDRYETVMGT